MHYASNSDQFYPRKQFINPDLCKNKHNFAQNPEFRAFSSERNVCCSVFSVQCLSEREIFFILLMELI